MFWASCSSCSRWPSGRVRLWRLTRLRSPSSTLTTPVSAGSTVTLTVKTATGAECKGTVRYRGFTQNLAAKAAGEDGTATWSWRLNADARGNYPVEVQCAQGDKKGSVTGDASGELVCDVRVTYNLSREGVPPGARPFTRAIAPDVVSDLFAGTRVGEGVVFV